MDNDDDEDYDDAVDRNRNSFFYSFFSLSTSSFCFVFIICLLFYLVFHILSGRMNGREKERIRKNGERVEKTERIVDERPLTRTAL